MWGWDRMESGESGTACPWPELAKFGHNLIPVENANNLKVICILCRIPDLRFWDAVICAVMISVVRGPGQIVKG